MAEYIKRDELAKWLKDESDSYSMKDVAPVGWTLIGLINELSKIPTADVVEQKHGKWNWVGFNIECSECGAMPNFDSTEPLYNFCPNCGADNRESEGK